LLSEKKARKLVRSPRPLKKKGRTEDRSKAAKGEVVETVKNVRSFQGIRSWDDDWTLETETRLPEKSKNRERGKKKKRLGKRNDGGKPLIKTG